MREEVQPFPADLGRSELNALTPVYFSGAHGQAQGGKGKGEEREVRGRKRRANYESVTSRELLAVLLVEVILLFLALVPPRQPRPLAWSSRRPRGPRVPGCPSSVLC